jgi:hypothetical protein
MYLRLNFGLEGVLHLTCNFDLGGVLHFTCRWTKNLDKNFVFLLLLVNMPVRFYGFLCSFWLLENDFVFLLIELAEANYRLLLPNIKKQ